MTNASPCPACRATDTVDAGRKNGFGLLRCCNCGTAFVDPMPGADTLRAFYSGYEKNANYLRKRDQKVRRARLRLRFSPARRGMRFLDVGCNAGYAVAAALDMGLDAHGIDIDSESIRLAREWLPAERFEVMSIQDHAARGRQADFIYTSEVIEHTPVPEEFVAGLALSVRPGGHVFLTCPDGGHFRTPRRLADWQAVKPPEHLVWYTRRGLKALFGRHGFTSIRFRPHLKPTHRMTARKA